MTVNLFFKRILNNRIAAFSLLFIVIAIPLILFLNAQLINEMGLRNILVKESQEFTIDINHTNSLIQDSTLSLEDRKIHENNIELAKQMIEQNQEIIQLLDDQNYYEAYDLMLAKKIDTQNAVFEHPEFYDDHYHQILESIKSEQDFYRYLIDHRLKADEYQPVYGWTFAFSIWNDLLPWLISILLIVILSVQYSKKFYNKLNIYRLRPISFYHEALKEIGLGLLLAILLWCSALLLAFGLGSLFFEQGSLNYPILTFNKSNGFVWLSLISIIGPTCLLQIFSLLSLVTTIYLVTFIFKNKLLSMVMTLLIITGSMIASYFIPFFESAAAWLPYTYLQSASVITGQYNITLPRAETNLNLGIGVNSTCILFLLMLTFLINNYRSYKYRNG